jgi:hypothetical protein
MNPLASCITKAQKHVDEVFGGIMRLLLRNLANSGANHLRSCEYDGVRQSPRCNRKAHCSNSIRVSVGVSEHVIVIVGTVGIFIGKLCGTALVK